MLKFNCGLTLSGITCKRFNRKAFTLAEVLITLGIIGVVAAMTIPNLIANTRSAQYRSGFKKAVSTLSQAARMSQAQYGFDYAGIDSVCGANAATEHPDEIMSICAILNGTLTGLTYADKISDLKINKQNSDQSYTVTSSYLTGLYGNSFSDSFHAYVLNDGSIFAFYSGLGRYNGCSIPIGSYLSENGYATGVDFTVSDCVGFIDVNGVNLPNKEVSCSSGSNALKLNTCIVKNDAQHMTDVFPVRVHDGIVEAATAAGRYVLKTAK